MGPNSYRLAGSASANQPADKQLGESATLLRFRRSHLVHHVWLRYTSAQSAQRAISVTRDANNAASFAVELVPVVPARIVTSRSLWLICSNQLSRPTSRQLAKDLLSTGFVDRR